jgi:formylglycine-generating enzyme required for sulfatase activity
MGENDQRPSNNPQRRVHLDTFEVQTNEVTRGDFTQFVKEAGYQINTGEVSTLEQDGDLPMTNTLWKDADPYCRWLGMRLLTESEWEKAARGMLLVRYSRYGALRKNSPPGFPWRAVMPFDQTSS